MSKIVFIEKTPDFYNLLSQNLSQEGFEVFSASDGEQGLKLIAEKKPDIAILDLILPKKDGIEILQEIKNSKEYKSVPIVILVKPENLGEAEDALKLGATTYLVKANYRPEHIIKTIKTLLLNQNKK